MLDVAYEYDEAVFHNDSRRRAKTVKLLAGDAQVLRLRAGDAPPLPSNHPAVADARTLLVETASRSVGAVVTAAAGCSPALPEPYAERLALVAQRGYKRQKCVDDVVHSLSQDE